MSPPNGRVYSTSSLEDRTSILENSISSKRIPCPTILWPSTWDILKEKREQRRMVRNVLISMVLVRVPKDMNLIRKMKFIYCESFYFRIILLGCQYTKFGNCSFLVSAFFIDCHDLQSKYLCSVRCRESQARTDGVHECP